ncbi:TlpA family protein disulfide reductase [Sulfuriflexus mobilis]|uniref:TlpA family protein disulfide reductase n=1 Tax=Sulfuriflexus mobilis TaxID=1811807 RepID=UPI000F821817|nr:TlpA disulfide reductase family protein [Sulfuriflexus mobilis]
MKKLLFIVLLFTAGQVLCAAPLSLPKGVIAVSPRPAPPLVLQNMDGQSFDLDKAGRQWAFVHFWASWCGPCRREIPSIEKLIAGMADSPLSFAIVNTAESDDTVFTFLGSVAPEINTLMDYDGLVTEAWQPRGLPSTYLVDPQGMIRYVVIGGQAWHSREYQDFLRHLTGDEK